MVTSTYEWKILEWDDKTQTNKHALSNIRSHKQKDGGGGAIIGEDPRPPPVSHSILTLSDTHRA